MSRNLRAAWAVAASAAILLTSPTQSYAIFHWFRSCCGPQPAAYAPPVVEAPLAAPTVVNYVPQTCYRTQYVTVPVTTYRPTVGRDPCTGCPVTAMRPTIAYVQQARMVPYTTYRPVVTSGCNPCGAARVGYAPVASYAAPSSSCSGCSAAPAAPAAPAALPPYYNAAPINSAPSSSPSIGAPTLAPGANPGTSSFQQRPIYGAESSGASYESRQKPIALPGPETGNGSSGPANGSNGSNGSTGGGSQGGDLNGPANANPTSAAPRLINPDDRTTQLSVPVRYAVHRVSNDQPIRAFSPIDWPRDAKAVALPASAPARPAAQPAPAASTPPASDADGWRPSQR